jgi:hypothetical protein
LLPVVGAVVIMPEVAAVLADCGKGMLVLVSEVLIM